MYICLSPGGRGRRSEATPGEGEQGGSTKEAWIPVCAGMTLLGLPFTRLRYTIACAGMTIGEVRRGERAPSPGLLAQAPLSRKGIGIYTS